MIVDRILSEKQHNALDRLADRDPEAVVVGWSDILQGPIIQLYDGSRKVCPFTGYLRIDREAP